jgi:hypothetical protein
VAQEQQKRGRPAGRWWELVSRNEARREADGSARPRIRKERIRVEREGKKGVVVILHFLCISIFLELF